MKGTKNNYLIRPIKVCDLCGFMKIVKPSKMNRGKSNFCSLKCQSKSYIGRKFPEEFGRKISKSKIGHTVSKETRDKIGRANKKHYPNPVIDWHDKDQLRKWKREYQRKWNKENPRSGTIGSPELKIRMDNIRARDKNTCQWFNCGLTYKQVPIHVHHIFPRSEYPELELEEKYMICYCANHHGLFHRYRGDKCYTFLMNNPQETISSCPDLDRK